MDEYLKFNDYSNDEIRPPDTVKKEKLIDNNFVFHENNNPLFNDYDYNLEQILEISKNEFDLVQQKEEEKIIELINHQKKEKLGKFDNIKVQLNKIILFDSLNISIYENILSIIEIYEQNLINEYNVNREEYLKIFNLLKTIRLPKNEVENLKKIIILID